MNLETIRQGVLNALTEQNFYREPPELADNVVKHVQLVETARLEKLAWQKMIPVDLDEVEAQYSNGFKTGASWNETYIPGGPFCFDARDWESDRFKAIAEQSKAEWAAWIQGFYDGNGISEGARNANRRV